MHNVNMRSSKFYVEILSVAQHKRELVAHNHSSAWQSASALCNESEDIAAL